MDILSYILGKKAGGGGGEAVLVNKSISANGTYNASSDSADGYKKVEVSVPASAVDSGTKSITSNGNGQDVVGYAAVDVAVPNSYGAGDEGKVVSDGALVSQTSASYTSNGTYDTTLVNEVEVAVGGIEPFGYILNRAATGDVVINVTNPPAENSTSEAMYQGLLIDCAVSSIKMTGLWFIPRYFVNQQNVGTNGSQSVLTSVESDARYCGNKAFAYAKALTSVKLYNLEVGYYNYQNISDEMFRYCTALQTIALPKLKRCDNTFGNCTSLTSVDFGAMEDIRANVFNGCSVLSNLVIRTSSLCALQNINSFTGTPFASGGSGGTLYVPSSLISSYQGATNWSTILGYANNQIKAIEGSIYETQYADGTPIT